MLRETSRGAGEGRGERGGGRAADSASLAGGAGGPSLAVCLTPGHWG